MSTGTDEGIAGGKKQGVNSTCMCGCRQVLICVVFQGVLPDAAFFYRPDAISDGVVHTPVQTINNQVEQRREIMKFKIFNMLVILGILSVMPLIYMGKFDPMSFIDGSIDDGVSEIRKLKSKAPQKLNDVIGEDKVKVYKWRDENGVMQFSNTPPSDGGRSEQVTLDPNSNVMKAIKVKAREEEAEPVAETSMPSPYSPKSMKKALEDAKGVEELLKKRHEEQQEMLKNL